MRDGDPLDHFFLGPKGELRQDADSLTCLRLVFMNRWVEGETFEGISYHDDFLASLTAYILEILSALTCPEKVVRPAG